jgi:hypothetical protein
MKKLRLLVTKDCPRDCAMCCNKGYDLDSLPIVDNFDYNEILITGGEPLSMKNIGKTTTLINYLNIIEPKSNRKIYVYTADSDGVVEIISIVAGVTLTLHTQEDVYDFVFNNSNLLRYIKKQNKSMKLNVFKDVKLPDNIDLSLWQVKKDLVWIKDCPLPTGEEFKRLRTLF